MRVRVPPFAPKTAAKLFAALLQLYLKASLSGGFCLMINVEIKKRKENEINLKIEVDKSKVNNKLEKVYNDLSYQVKIPGFRKGKIPRNILNLHLGKEYFYQKTAEILIPDSYIEAVKKVSIEPIDQPKINIIQMEEDKTLIFEATIQVKPEFKVGSLEKIKIHKEVLKITDIDVENEIKRIQESQAVLKVVKDRKAKEGDFVVIDSEGYIDSQPIKDTKVKKQLLQLGKGYLPKFDKQLLGCSAGEEKEIKVLVPKDAKDKEIAGKEIIYKIKVFEIKEKELPEVNNDIAKTVGDFKSLNDLKKDIKKKLTRQVELINKNNFERKLLEKVAEVCEVKVPEVLIERETNYIIESLENDLKARKLSLQDYYKSINSDEEKVKKEYRIVAEKRIKQELILDKITREEDIKVTEKEIKNKINTIAKEIKQEPLKVETNFKKNNNLDGLKENIKREKVIDFISKKIKLIESKKEDKSK